MITNKKSITYKFLRAFIFLIVIPIFIISVIINTIYINALLKNSSERILQAMEQISLAVDNEAKRVSLTASTLAYDDGIMSLVDKWVKTEDAREKFEISKQIDSKLGYLFNYSNDIDSVMFFFKGDNTYFYKNNPIITTDEIKKMNWYNSTVKNKGKTCILGSIKHFTSNSNNKYTVSVSISPKDTAINNDVELIYFSFHTNIYTSFYNDLKYNRTGEMLILDEDNKILVSRNDKYIGNNLNVSGLSKSQISKNGYSSIESVKGIKKLISVYDINKTNWKIISIVDYNEITRDIDKISSYAIAISALALILFVTFSFQFFRDIISPINHLIRKMKQVEKGNFDVVVEIKRDDEVYQLGKTFNRMVQEIKNLIEERDLKERERNKAEIEVLQSQINPHFLSNTLNSIRLMAMIAKVDSIKNMTDAFCKLLAASFGKNGVYVTIKDELENLNNYIYIMKVRYGDKFDVNIKVVDKIKEMYILRLLLQPILENAILHGVNELEHKGIIDISGFIEENRLVFEVMDNGIGMTDEQLSKILLDDCRESKGFRSIGVKNVDKRIKLNHGNNYGLTIESTYSEYTKVRIRLPIITKVDKREENESV